MVWQRLAVAAFTILALAYGSLLPAQAEEKQPAGKDSDRLDALARKLNLSDRQKQQVKAIYADFDRKADPLLRQLCKHREHEWQTLQTVLNEGQKAKLKEVFKTQGAKELQSIAQKLNLTAEQKEKVEKIRKDFLKKFLDLSMRKGENLAREYRELHAEVIAAAREVLTPDQRAKLPAIQKQDFDEFHDYIYQPDHLKALGEQLGLSAAQLNQLQQSCTTCEKEIVENRAKLKELCATECAALEKVLNAEQRARFHEVFPFHFLAAEQPSAEKRQKE